MKSLHLGHAAQLDGCGYQEYPETYPKRLGER
jgi:hypothetical protein